MSKLDLPIASWMIDMFASLASAHAETHDLSRSEAKVIASVECTGLLVEEYTTGNAIKKLHCSRKPLTHSKTFCTWSVT